MEVFRVLVPLKDVFSNFTWISLNSFAKATQAQINSENITRVCGVSLQPNKKLFRPQRSNENIRAASQLTSLRQQSWQQSTAVTFVRMKQPCLMWTFKIWFSVNQSGALLSVVPCEHLRAQASFKNSFWTPESIQEWRKSSEVHLTQIAISTHVTLNSGFRDL